MSEQEGKKCNIQTQGKCHEREREREREREKEITVSKIIWKFHSSNKYLNLLHKTFNMYLHCTEIVPFYAILSYYALCENCGIETLF